MCDACEKSGGGHFEGLNEIVANPERRTYLCGCPRCGALWMGHGMTPQLMIELTTAQAVEHFPGWRPPYPPVA